MTYPMLVLNINKDGHTLKAWPHGHSRDSGSETGWSWCVEHSRPGDYKPPMTAGANRPGWPEFYHKETEWDVAEWAMTKATELGALELLPVHGGLRVVHKLKRFLEQNGYPRRVLPAARPEKRHARS